MSKDAHYTMAKPHLIDLIDSEWAQDKLEDDGNYFILPTQ